MNGILEFTDLGGDFYAPLDQYNVRREQQIARLHKCEAS